MNKNWNDRADKDLFFTILSVKNIGVISGSEWTTIGNHMRSLGYGFTNEGCRQHFQGLRRAQNKTDTNGLGDNSPRRVDPTLNPITRRPGPGRGRPRKLPGQQSEDPEQTIAAAQPQPEPEPEIPLTPVVAGPPPPAPPPAPMMTPLHHDVLDFDPTGDPTDEHEVKRPRLDDGTDPSLEDEAVVLSALAAANNQSAVDHYAQEFGYGEA